MRKIFHENFLLNFEIDDQKKEKQNLVKSQVILNSHTNFIKTLASLSISRCQRKHFSPIPILLHEINQQARRFNRILQKYNHSALVGIYNVFLISIGPKYKPYNQNPRQEKGPINIFVVDFLNPKRCEGGVKMTHLVRIRLVCHQFSSKLLNSFW